MKRVYLILVSIAVAVLIAAGFYFNNKYKNKDTVKPSKPVANEQTTQEEPVKDTIPQALSLSYGNVSNEVLFSKEFKLPPGLFVLGIKDDNTLLIKYETQALESTSAYTLYSYDIRTGNIKEYIRTVHDGMFLTYAAIDGNYLYWSETSMFRLGQSSMFKLGQGSSYSWYIYVKNLSTGEVRLVDHAEAIDPIKDAQETPLQKIALYNPQQFILKEEKLLYTCLNMDSDTLALAIKLYDCKTGKLKVIDSIQNYQDLMYSQPDISGNKVVWSLFRGNLENDYNGIMYLYDLTENKKEVLSKDSLIYNPSISGDKVYAYYLYPEKKYGIRGIVSYDLTKKSWNTIFSFEIPDAYKQDMKRVGQMYAYNSKVVYNTSWDVNHLFVVDEKSNTYCSLMESKTTVDAYLSQSQRGYILSTYISENLPITVLTKLK